MTPEELRTRTRKFATDIVQYCETLPKDPRAQEIARQLVDAATGVGSNYRSVCRARSTNDFINKLAIALDCADESFYWLQVLVESNVTTDAVTAGHRREAEELTRILAASLRTARRSRRRQKETHGRGGR
jgi:four helix bundle protein